MKLFQKICIVLLLLFNGSGAIFGGSSLMLHPDGSGIQLSMHWLEHTPFSNYFIPGIILFVANGLFSTFTLVALLLKYRHYGWLVMAQGAILSGWIIIQMLLIRTFHPFHLILGLTGVLLFLLGWMEVKQRS